MQATKATAFIRISFCWDLFSSVNAADESDKNIYLQIIVVIR